jgi:hypothetical protein
MRDNHHASGADFMGSIRRVLLLDEAERWILARLAAEGISR